MNQLRTLVSQMEQEQLFDLESGEKKIRSSSHRALRMILIGASGSLLLILAESLWITRQMRRQMLLEDRLRAAHQLQQAVLDSAGFSIIATDPEGKIHTFNRAAEKILGYSASEIVGKATPEIFHDREEVARRNEQVSRELNRPLEPGFETFVAKTREENRPDEQVWTYVRKDGTRIPVSLTVGAIHDDEGRLSGYVGIAYDIREKLKLEKMKDEFLSSVSHEMRTPLAILKGHIDNLYSGYAGPLGDRQAKVVEVVRRNVARLGRLINDLLDISRLESGRSKANLKPHDLLRIVRETHESFSEEAQAKKIRLSTRHPEYLDPIIADGEMVTQVLYNLISNALRFAKNHIEIRLKTVRFGAGEGVQVTVEDDGVGIESDKLPLLFNKFQQINRPAGGGGYQGTGLGLAICKDIIELHHGDIWAESTVGQGTQFHFIIPFALEASTERKDNSNEPEKTHLGGR